MGLKWWRVVKRVSGWLKVMMRSEAANDVQFDKVAADMHSTWLSSKGTSSKTQLLEITLTARCRDYMDTLWWMCCTPKFTILFLTAACPVNLYVELYDKSTCAPRKSAPGNVRRERALVIFLFYSRKLLTRLSPQMMQSSTTELTYPLAVRFSRWSVAQHTFIFCRPF